MAGRSQGRGHRVLKAGRRSREKDFRAGVAQPPREAPRSGSQADEWELSGGGRGAGGECWTSCKEELKKKNPPLKIAVLAQ